MCKNRYCIEVSGSRTGREPLIGSLIENSANLTTEFSYRNGGYTFFFKYRGDARLVLKRITKQFSGKSLPVNNEYSHEGAVARIKKIS